MNKVFFGDCRGSMRQMKTDGIKVQMCVTSPPYFGLRSYDENAVRINPALSDGKREWLLAELAKRGINASA